jgi:two-component system, chemotaxis family, CheB/CheR fusion protein
MTESVDQREFEALLEYLKRTRGFDFHAYKPTSLTRRVQKRMQSIAIDRFGDYTDYLEVHPDEFAHLFDSILINVTSFFRDDPTWDHVRDDVIPNLVSEAQPGDGRVRVWSAGCASGEEPYSMAMLFAEAIGRDQFAERVKIYATDVDDHALTEARQATYTEKQVQGVAPALLEKYFVRDGDRFVVDRDLRRSVIFGHHDLVQDAPISRINVLLCRNTLMYFNTEAQGRMLARFHFALADHGVLVVGKAEMLMTHPQMFAPVDLRRRIFRKVSNGNWRDRMAIMSQANGQESSDPAANQVLMYPSVFDAGPLAQVVIDGMGRLSMCNGFARELFGLSLNDIGRPVQDLEMSYRPLELRSLIAQAVEERHPVLLRDIEWKTGGRDVRHFDVYVTPLSESGRPAGVSISLVDVSRAQDLQAQLIRSKQDLETAYEELQSTTEELETTNEELQSTVEELETTNEELQSTNEELETMNEELQSTNEELQTINEELRGRSDDLNRANGFLESILTGVRSGVVVLDRELHVIAWNHRAEDLWGLRGDEVRGQNFLNLDIGLPIDQLRAGIRQAFNGDGEFGEIIVPATNRRGKSIACKVTTTPLTNANKDVRGVILMMDEQVPADRLG